MKEFIVQLIDDNLCLVDADNKCIGVINPEINFLIEGDILFENEILVQPVVKYYQKPSVDLIKGDVVFINRLCNREYDVIGTIDEIINDSTIFLTNVQQYVFEFDTKLMEDLVVSRREIIGRKTLTYIYNIAIKDPNQDIWYGKIEKI